MNYFKDNNNNVFAYDDAQVAQGYGNDLSPITDAEKDDLLAPTTEQVIETANAEARAYLLQTDWYVVRNAETGEEIPADILTKRQEARDSVQS